MEYAGRGDLFEGLSIWEEKSPLGDYKYRQLQGTYPVIMLSFADIKETSFAQARKAICRTIKLLFDRFDFLLEGDLLSQSEKDDFRQISVEMEDNAASFSLKVLSIYLSRYFGRKVIILLDEYDTPMQEAYVNGYWEEMVAFTRSLFNATFKTNPYPERAIMTGITRISRESMFSDLNNLEVVTITSEKYADSFGFTEEVFAALDEYGLSDRKEGPIGSIPVLTAWLGNWYVRGSPELKMTMERLLQDEGFRATLDEQVVFNQLDQGDDAIWSLLLASGYLKAEHVEFKKESGETEYNLNLSRSDFIMVLCWG